MTKRSVAHGCADLEDFQISPEGRELIEWQLERSKIENPSPEFFQALELAAARFVSLERIHSDSKPAAMRAELKKAANLALRLEQALEQMHPVSNSLIRKASGMSAARFRDRKVTTTVEALEGARQLADNLPGRGSLVDEAKAELAIDVAVAMSKHLGRKPATTKEGLYASLLSIMLEQVTGKEPKSVQKLVKQTFEKNTQIFSTQT